MIVLSNFDLYSPRYHNLNFMIGEGLEQGTILSITRCKNNKKEVIKQAALHEFGHTFANLDHCNGRVGNGENNECTMKFPNRIPYDLELQARYKNKTGVLFCDKHELKEYGLNIEFNRKHLIHFPEVEELKNNIYSLNPRLLKILDSGKLALLETKIMLE